MTFRTALLAGVILAPLAGCASSIERVRETVAAAPDWYDARATEVRGEGYPNIAGVPTLQAGERGPVRDLDSGRRELQDAERLFRMDPRAVPPGLELAEMQAWAARVKAELDAIAAEPGDFLTDEEVAQARALFERARGQLQG